MATAVAWLDELDPAEAVTVAGSKMGRLTEMMRSGVSVPRGFTVTAQTYRRHCEEAGLHDEIDRILGDLPRDPSDEQIETAAGDVKARIERTPLSEALVAEITDAYRTLCERCSENDLPVAVRSSATGEDGSTSSFAGIFDTYLGLSGTDRVLDAVKRCWGSLFSPRALRYRYQRGVSHHDMPMAVGVIELVQAHASGVGFSQHPVTGKRDRMVIEASWGWGEAIVQGLVTPDHVEVGKSDSRVLRHDVSHKTVISSFDFDKGEVVEADMPADLRDEQVLTEAQIVAIAEAMVSIEEHYGYPVDVEWVLGKEEQGKHPVFIVQARPVTVGGCAADETAEASTWDPVAFANKYAFQSDR
jgi:pyruvate,water dikinase